LSRYDGEEFVSFARESRQPNNDVLCVLEDRAGNLWYGTWGGGVARFDGKEFTTFTTEDGLASNVVSSILEDRKGDLWFGTGVGRRGKRWFSGTAGGVSRDDGEGFVTYTSADGLGSNFINLLFEDRAGLLWFGCGDGGLSRYDGERFVTFSTIDGLRDNTISAIYEGSDGSLWIGRWGEGVSRFEEKEGFVTYTTATAWETIG
jgi:ligand-binding sensor domain-containing protein